MSKSTQKTDISVADSYKKIERRWKKLSAEARLTSPRSTVRSLENEVIQLSDEIAAVRKRGYVFAATMEKEAKQLRSRWILEERAAKKIIRDADAHLKKLVRDAERQLGVAEKRLNLHDDVERKLDLIETEADGVSERVNDSLRDVRDGVNKVKQTLREATKLLDALTDASFDLYPDEHAVAMRPAENIGRNEGEGILFLTDKRILFERREKRATKKRFFITVESEMVTEVVWEAPIGAIVSMTAKDKGGFIGIGDKDLLMLTFADDVRDAPEKVTVRFRKYSDNEAWAETLLPYVKSGKIAEERIDVTESSTEFDTSNLPTICPTCKAPLPKIYRGMHQVECEFCGTAVNVN